MEFKPGPNYFGKLHHPAIGIRIPEIFLEGITSALRKHNCAAGLMLSFGRETAPEHVIKSPPYRHPLTQGHTGTSIRHYQSAAANAAREAGIAVEVEADHLIIIGTPERAATRITGVHKNEEVSEDMVHRSLRYIDSELKEAKSLGLCRCFTIDASDLFDEGAMKLRGPGLKKAFDRVFPLPVRKNLINKYSGKTFSFAPGKGRPFSIKLDEEEVMRLALRYKRGLDASRVIYRRIMKDFGPAFGFEISLDETREVTRLEEAFFYLAEWTGGGCHFDYFAPNIGFGKRADFRGSRSGLRERARRLAAVASFFDGAFLSIHSGSGSSPWSGKGRGVYEALLAGTGGNIKYKISGVYFELLLEILAARPGGSRPRALYEEIFDAVAEYCERQIERKGFLATSFLQDQWKKYQAQVKKDPRMFRNPRADFLRFHSYLALAFRGPKGGRPHRDALVKLYRTDPGLKHKIDKEVEALTERLIRGLGFANNIKGRI